MNAAHLHLMFYHLPIGGLLAGAALLAGGKLSGNQAVQRAALCVLVASGILVLPAHLTGDPASELVSKLPGIHKELIEAHETWGHASLTACLITGVLAFLGLWFSRAGRNVTRVWFGSVIVVALLSIGIVSVTAWRGGSINHAEFNSK